MRRNMSFFRPADNRRISFQYTAPADSDIDFRVINAPAAPPCSITYDEQSIDIDLPTWYQGKSLRYSMDVIFKGKSVIGFDGELVIDPAPVVQNQSRMSEMIDARLNALLPTLKGEKGDAGKDGKDGVINEITRIIEPVYIKGDKGDAGKDGLNGISIKGDKGDKGDTGKDGVVDTTLIEGLQSQINQLKSDTVASSFLLAIGQASASVPTSILTNTTVAVNVIFNKTLPNTDYKTMVNLDSNLASLLAGMTYVVTNKTTTGCTVTVKNATVVSTAGVVSVTVFAVK